MPKKNWNNFVTKYPNAATFSSGVSVSLPKSARKFDKNQKRLPTPYGLLVEWCDRNLNGEWASLKVGKVVAVKVVDQADIAKILKNFPAVGSPKNSQLSKSTQQIAYGDSDYGNLAGRLGYKF